MTNPAHVEFVATHFARSLNAMQDAAADRDLLVSITDVATQIGTAFARGNKLLICGNGGSAADAQHMAAELVGRFRWKRAPLAAIALTTDTSALTAIANDFSFEQVFARQVRGLGRLGDALLAISTSGRSANVLEALAEARHAGLATYGLTGNQASPMAQLCTVCLRAPHSEPALIQQIHIVALHAICVVIDALMEIDLKAAATPRSFCDD